MESSAAFAGKTNKQTKNHHQPKPNTHTAHKDLKVEEPCSPGPPAAQVSSLSGPFPRQHRQVRPFVRGGNRAAIATDLTGLQLIMNTTGKVNEVTQFKGSKFQRKQKS